MNEKQLCVYEVFRSISGECGKIPQGAPATFIRLNGCNLRCRWCDTPNTQRFQPPNMTVDDVIHEAVRTFHEDIIITGGEPLFQPACVDLILKLTERTSGIVQIETNGTIPILPSTLRHNNCFVVDYKLHATDAMHPGAFWNLRSQDFVKIVVESLQDLERIPAIVQWAVHPVGGAPTFALSPLMKDGQPSVDCNKVLHTIETCARALRVPMILNVQIHKFLKLA